MRVQQQLHTVSQLTHSLDTHLQMPAKRSCPITLNPSNAVTKMKVAVVPLLKLAGVKFTVAVADACPSVLVAWIVTVAAVEMVPGARSRPGVVVEKDPSAAPLGMTELIVNE